MAEDARENVGRSNDAVSLGDGAGTTFNGADYQVGGTQYADLSSSGNNSPGMNEFPSASHLLSQMDGGPDSNMQQFSPGADNRHNLPQAAPGNETSDGAASRPRTEEEMQSVDRNSAEVKKLFPGAENQELRDAAYRYLMHRECVDDYSASFKKDSEMLEKHAPGSVDKLEEIIRQRRQQGGPAPGSHPCEAVS